MEPEKKTKITIIGAGLIGTTLSYYLSLNTNFNITVYEKERENSFLTSYANAGRFVPIGKFQLNKKFKVILKMQCLSRSRNDYADLLH